MLLDRLFYLSLKWKGFYMTDNNKIIGFLKLLKTYVNNDVMDEKIRVIILQDIEYYINYLSFKNDSIVNR